VKRRKRTVVSQLEKHHTRVRTALQILVPKWHGSEIAEHEETLGHLTACLRLFEPDWAPPPKVGKRPCLPVTPFEHGKLLNMAYDVLREAQEPISSLEIMTALGKSGRVSGFHSRSYTPRRDLTTLLLGQVRVGAIRREGLRPIRWSIIHSPGQG
jgi:hypothetical protein